MQEFLVPRNSCPLLFPETKLQLLKNPEDSAASTAIVDVIVVGGGNAAMCAALSASESGATVLVLERAPEAARGGNSAFTGGAFRVAYENGDDIERLVPDLSAEDKAKSDFGTYPKSQFFDELMSMSSLRADADLIELLVNSSFETMEWLRSQGVRFIPSYGRQSYLIEGRQKFWGGLTIEVSGGGVGLMEALYRRAARAGVTIAYDHNVQDLVIEHGRIVGVVAKVGGEMKVIRAGAVVLGAGGFHANAAWRASYLGPGWDLAKVRGSRYNTGDCIGLAMRHGARAKGHWSGCHGVFYDANAPEFGDIDLLDQQKNYFTLGIVVNANGERFINEGEDFRNYTYSRMGAELLRQPGGIGWQIFDAKTSGLLPNEYRVKHATRITADTLDGLIQKIEGVNRERLARTIREFNASVDRSCAFNPGIKDGLRTNGLQIDKTNWAVPLEQGPFTAFEVTTGITCTFGGLAINTSAEVLSVEGPPLQGLYAVGEMVGGLYYVKYPGGAGLTSGSVFGRIAGREAAAFVAAQK
ncbi:FAD-dependent tricarballylate dehydrogenase TcuA [Polaromonas hydrogenivorans]|uniref:FAD-dependent tricarballylate dehydrogenase TcuA n=1 Tax=Polaromonas hydrogenivorans TaxID=335476 RepID=A0AAU7LXX1_9BURK